MAMIIGSRCPIRSDIPGPAKRCRTIDIGIGGVRLALCPNLAVKPPMMYSSRPSGHRAAASTVPGAAMRCAVIRPAPSRPPCRPIVRWYEGRTPRAGGTPPSERNLSPRSPLAFGAVHRPPKSPVTGCGSPLEIARQTRRAELFSRPAQSRFTPFTKTATAKARAGSERRSSKGAPYDQWVES